MIKIIYLFLPYSLKTIDMIEIFQHFFQHNSEIENVPPHFVDSFILPSTSAISRNVIWYAPLKYSHRGQVLIFLN